MSEPSTERKQMVAALEAHYLAKQSSIGNGGPRRWFTKSLVEHTETDTVPQALSALLPLTANSKVAELDSAKSSLSGVRSGYEIEAVLLVGLRRAVRAQLLAGADDHERDLRDAARFAVYGEATALGRLYRQDQFISSKLGKTTGGAA